MTSENIVDHI